MKALWKWTKLILKVLAAIAVIGGLFSYAMFQGGFVSWFLFYTVMSLFLLLILYALIPLGNFQVERRAGDGAMSAGNELKIEIIIERKWLFPFLYLAVEDVAEDTLTKQLPFQASKMIFYPTMKRRLSYSYIVPELKRGKYYSYGVKLSTSDLFGFVNKEKFVSMPSELLVYPKYHDIEQWEAFEKHETETTMSLQDFIEDRTSIAGAREYVPGDKLTSLDWKATARASKLMTKEFEEYMGQNFLVILNNKVTDSSFAVSDAYEKGIELVTSLVMYAYKEQLQLGFWSFGTEKKKFPVGLAAEQQKEIIAYLAQLRPARSGSFAASLKQAENDVSQGVTLVIISVELTDESLKRLKVLLGRRVRIFFALMDKGKGIDPWEFRRLKELREAGADAYVLSEGHWSKEN
ncbi:DUF58 domain-containing protein [Alkalicoccus daliensis]|uniref:Uncharacterized conserved protein, DUF58 family, contains vWF domain n=1 Tax=Alkalicoccus daliensis TaxID=745820 RepID=A0A1H0KIZ9_9BACI|nr:DUF58 domain-containing protein [Alkalicoccus daliensis]SDO55721.1 Uncharacterized conserved protein, DUF58 family, contains vWF domain [Alkalicoccus daliensis]